MASKGYVAIPGSGREPLPGATKSGPCDPQESVQVTMVLRPRPRGKKVKPLATLISRGERLTRSKFAALYGADTKDVDRVRAFARARGVQVLSGEPRRPNRHALRERRRIRPGLSSRLGAL